jgi:simple sugar transport system ATP-binding protein
MSDYLIQFNNVSKFFGKVIALKDVTMKLKKGEIMCVCWEIMEQVNQL